MMKIFVCALLILTGGGPAALTVRRPAAATLISWCSVIPAAGLGCVAALGVLLSGQSFSRSLPWPVPGGEFALLLAWTLWAGGHEGG